MRAPLTIPDSVVEVKSSGAEVGELVLVVVGIAHSALCPGVTWLQVH